jgi:hypothetical protein
MTLEEYNKNLGGVIRDLQSGAHAEVMVKMAVNAVTMIKKRVQETGTDAKGTKYKPYSTKSTLVGCKTFIQKSTCAALLGSKAKRKELEWRTIGGHRLSVLPGGYKKIRELQGRQTAFVDFSVTNAMWNDINIISKQNDHQKGIAIIGAKQDIEKKKLAGNTKRRGDILDLSEKEIGELKQIYNVGVLQIFRNNGL